MKTYKDRTKEDLWNEIKIIIESTHFSETDKEMIIKLIRTWSIK